MARPVEEEECPLTFLICILTLKTERTDILPFFRWFQWLSWTVSWFNTQTFKKLNCDCFLIGLRPVPGNNAATGNSMNEFSHSHHRVKEVPESNERETKPEHMSEEDDDRLSRKSDRSDNNSSNDNAMKNGRRNSADSPTSWKGDCNFCGKEFESPSELAKHVKSQCKEAAAIMKQEKSSPVVSLANSQEEKWISWNI